MATVVRFTLKEKNDCYAYYCNQSDNQSGEYISLKEHEQRLNDLAYQVHKLREALESIAYANLTTQSNDTWVDEAQMIIIAQKALND